MKYMSRRHFLQAHYNAVPAEVRDFLEWLFVGDSADVQARSFEVTELPENDMKKLVPVFYALSGKRTNSVNDVASYMLHRDTSSIVRDRKQNNNSNRMIFKLNARATRLLGEKADELGIVTTVPITPKMQKVFNAKRRQCQRILERFAEGNLHFDPAHRYSRNSLTWAQFHRIFSYWCVVNQERYFDEDFIKLSYKTSRYFAGYPESSEHRLEGVELRTTASEALHEIAEGCLQKG